MICYYSTNVAYTIMLTYVNLFMGLTFYTKIILWCGIYTNILCYNNYNDKDLLCIL